MKKLYLTSFVILCLGLTVQAQFLMKSNTHILRAGDKHYFNITNNADPGAEGPDVTWNFKDLENKSTLTSYMYSAYTTPYSADIPEANTVLEEFENKFYFKAAEGIIEQYGTVTKNNTLTIYDKPFVKMVFPFNYGDTYSGDFSGTVYGNDNYEAKFTGTYLLEADAYGTLILPGNIQYKNVSRIKTIKEQCYNKSNNCNCATISYKWYSEDVRYPVLTIIRNKTSKGIKTVRSAYYSKAKNNSENQANKGLIAENIEAKIYPNPFISEFKIDYTITKDSDIRIEIYDNSGRLVKNIQKRDQLTGHYTETITGSDLGNQQGIYHVRIISDDGVLSKTVIRGE